ncbi:helix-turn-helix domain-containing protein [Lysinibacillus sphaericus]|uniref:helix-turn-helix domain-containing protein n=1 Tax=Lysinibacillus sphaericus TaxID=1421 RepID=UPI001CBF8885|nr:helix-turn-helix transcriptional regulator [Lysinibacillus sphaericus]
MKTNDNVIKKIKNWLEGERKSYQWLSDQLEISKSFLGFILNGERILKLERIEQLAKRMGISSKE